MAYITLKLEISGAIATITLNRPEKRNAISADMIEDILAAPVLQHNNGFFR